MKTGHVVDASVLVAALVDTSADGRWSEAVIAEGDLVAPHLAIVEALNILRRLEQAALISPSEAAATQVELQDLIIDLAPIRPFERRIWELRHNLTCYDAWFVAVAESLDLPLATLDRRLARASGPRCHFRTPP